MSSSIYNNLFRVSVTNSRRIFNHQPSSQHERSHYQHGIPGIPSDGKVIKLKNSNTGGQLYLVGTVHVSKKSAETVKKVIDYVSPDVVAVELCFKRAIGLMKWKPEEDTFCKLFRSSMRAPGGLCMKIYIFILNYWYHRLHADGIFPGLEFKVAMEESARVGALCICIDQDIDVTLLQLSKVSSFDLLWKAYARRRDEVKKSRQTIERHTDFIDGEYTRSFVQEMCIFDKKLCPEISQVLIEDRDKYMFTNLRCFPGKVVAVVGMAHMDGIELLWKLAEEDDNSNAC
ncbi:hypothetical protein MKW92_042923 [Papaver armeniacum]|nr:hypothetical protein MKW92_042923 [Papaver armeniacum]